MFAFAIASAGVPDQLVSKVGSGEEPRTRKVLYTFVDITFRKNQDISLRILQRRSQKVVADP